MRSIIALVDFTENSTNAARYAADMAAFIDAELHLVHVLDLPDIPVTVPIPDYALDEMRNSCFSSLETLARELTDQTGRKVQVATDLETGALISNVKNFCQWKKPFLVVMGEPSEKDLKQLPFPLLVVPLSARFHPIKNITLLCDEDEIKNGIPVPLGFLKELRDLLGAHFDILNINVKGQETASKIVKDQIDLLTKDFPEINLIDATGFQEGVRKYLDTHTVDWLMVFPKRFSFFPPHKSISKDIVLHCPLPVVSVTKK